MGMPVVSMTGIVQSLHSLEAQIGEIEDIHKRDIVFRIRVMDRIGSLRSI